MHRGAIGWRIAAASSHALRRDRELLVVPLATAVGAALAFAAVAVPGFLRLGGPRGTDVGDARFWLLLVAAGAVALGVAVLTRGALEPPARTRRLLGWTVLATVVSLALGRLEHRLGGPGRVVSRLGGSAFSVLSLVALPVIAFRGVGAVEGVRRSAGVVRPPRREPLEGRRLLVALPLVAVAAGLVAAGAVAPEVVVVLLVGVWTVVVLAFTSALTGAPRPRR